MTDVKCGIKGRPGPPATRDSRRVRPAVWHPDALGLDAWRPGFPWDVEAYAWFTETESISQDPEALRRDDAQDWVAEAYARNLR